MVDNANLPTGHAWAVIAVNRRRLMPVPWEVLTHHSVSAPPVQYSRLTIGAESRSPGDLYKPGDACVAPTQICPRHDRYGVPGRFMGAVAVAYPTRKTIIYGNLRFGSHRVRGVRGQQS